MTSEKDHRNIEIPIPKELENDDFAIVESESYSIVLMKVEGAYRAVDRICPHEDGDLADGAMIGKNIKCPVHGYIYDLGNGKCINRTSASGAQVYEVIVNNDSLLLVPHERVDRQLGRSASDS